MYQNMSNINDVIQNNLPPIFLQCELISKVEWTSSKLQKYRTLKNHPKIWQKYHYKHVYYVRPGSKLTYLLENLLKIKVNSQMMMMMWKSLLIYWGDFNSYSDFNNSKFRIFWLKVRLREIELRFFRNYCLKNYFQKLLLHF